MYSKIKISGTIEVVTGLHIGGGGESSMIGAIDSPVVRDLQTKLPIIPGSSIKGKMRSLLAKHFGLKMKQENHNQDDERVLRLFGSSEKGNIQRARLQISDAFFSEKTKEHFAQNDIAYTETKFENAINRLTAVANPRQIERVTRGSEFDFVLIYNVDEESQVEDDFENIEKAIHLLENDYLGGGGTRGNGRIQFNDINIETVVGEYDSTNLKIK
ncbi:TPA: type III-A CRISPR-associated RAMP protein Csm3 [Staphylococcus argenteus]|uniref:CRISPR system Cms endoribonuclease Csm3 n=1 Tax=Staphylococcus argenteus TaxID=985002 RepID=A0A7U7JS47_9STAP|nr:MULTISPECIES: type III-A CRISPR-associated RAMP protein Csm3 [Staphylococcus]ATY55757.1 type III-A CRISPR-associated RAMP protein Csm3 [Staphylococcus argenteus]ATZ85995.1 type III-A CRISPR-associated RAMP protein Csm3 [Staphylococcus argenteus]EYG83327.1 CRISPR type III-a/mtube-associated ramp protein csm3 [Staphylococcus argenteus]EYL84035.1 CRISPR type III-a/mtube-associated ramp protein csm3 [Staphylococcus argenteus]MBE2083858.1 type III-A CRISPR-associated RAMP protein Csm3 [Staphyloc